MFDSEKYIVMTHFLKFLFLCIYRFVGDQEAWHELSELYINEHE